MRNPSHNYNNLQIYIYITKVSRITNKRMNKILQTACFWLCLTSLNTNAIAISDVVHKPLETKNANEIRLLVTADLGYFHSDKRIPGSNVSEMIRAFKRHLSIYHPDISLKKVQVEREDLLDALMRGEGDVVATTLVITDERRKLIDFTEPYMRNSQQIVITRDEVKSFDPTKDLSGKNVWTKNGTAHFRTLLKINDHYSESNLPPIQIHKLNPGIEDIDLVRLLSASHLDLIILDNHRAKLWLDQFHNLKAHYDSPLTSGSDIAWGIRKDSDNLKMLLDEFIKETRPGRPLNAVINSRSRDSSKLLYRIIETDMSSKAGRYESLFKKYGQYYNIDPALIQAIAFQESSFFPNVIGPNNRVGLLQTPRSDSKQWLWTNIDAKSVDLLDVEENVKYGSKMLSRIYHYHFCSPDIDRSSQIRFTLAAYHLSPRSIQEARLKAQELGYNPNIWNHNVAKVIKQNFGNSIPTHVARVVRHYRIYKQIDAIHKLNRSEP